MTRPPSWPAPGPVDDPVCTCYDVEVVLDQNDRPSALDEAIQQSDQVVDILHVQSSGGLVEHVHLVPDVVPISDSASMPAARKSVLSSRSSGGSPLIDNSGKTATWAPPLRPCQLLPNLGGVALDVTDRGV